MTVTPVVRRMLIGAVAVFLVAGVLAAAVIAGDGGDTKLATESSTTVTASPTGDGGDPPAPGAAPAEAGATTAPAAKTDDAASRSGGATTNSGQSTPTTAGGATTPTTAGGTSAAGEGFAELGPADDPGAVAVPKAGTYRYRTKQADKTSEGTTKIEDKGASGGGRKLVTTMTGQGRDSTSDLIWGPDDVKVTQTTFGKATCDWDPDHLEMKIALSKGATWSSTSSCTVTFGTTAARITRTSSSKVIDARRVRVAGQEIPVWVFESTEKFEAPGQGGGEIKRTTWFSPAHGVVVRSIVEAQQGRGEVEILNLQPE